MTQTVNQIENELESAGLPADHRFSDPLTAEQFLVLTRTIPREPAVVAVLNAWSADLPNMAGWLLIEYGATEALRQSRA